MTQNSDTSDSETSQWPARVAILTLVGGLAFIGYGIAKYVYESLADGLTAVEAGNIGMVLFVVGLFLLMFFLHEGHKGNTLWEDLKQVMK